MGIQISIKNFFNDKELEQNLFSPESNMPAQINCSTSFKIIILVLLYNMKHLLKLGRLILKFFAIIIFHVFVPHLILCNYFVYPFIC